MRKFFVFTFLLLFISIYSVGHTFQLLGGFSSLKNNIFEGDDDNSKGAFFAGMGFELGLGQLRLNNTYTYSPKTQKFEFNGQSRSYQFHTITSDLTMKYKIFTYTSPYLLAGGFLSFSSYKPKGASGKVTNDSSEKLWDFGLVLGAGLEFFVKSLSLMIEGKYRRGRAYLEIGDMTFRTNEIVISFILNIY